MAHKNILKITALAATLALIGCGGGGSDGYYDSSPKPDTGSGTGNGTGTNPGTPTAPNAELLSIGQSKSSLNAGGEDKLTLTIRTLDKQGGVIPNAAVKLEILDAAASGASLSTPSSVNSDENGTITTDLSLSNSNLGQRINRTIKLKITSGSAVQELEIPVNGTALSITSDVNLLEVGNTATITLTALDAVGKPLVGAKAGITDSNSNDIGTTKLTDSAGKATFTVPYATVLNRANQRLELLGKISVNTNEQTVNNLITTDSVTLVANVANDTLQVTSNSNGAGVGEAKAISIKVNAATQNELTNKTVTFATSNGTVTPEKATITNIRQENGKWVGDAKTNLVGAIASVATVSAQFGNNTIYIAQKVNAGAPEIITLQSEASVLAPGANTKVIALVKDANGSPVPNTVVKFTILKDTSSNGRISQPTAITDSAGRATVIYTAGTAQTLGGGVQINAMAGNATVPKPVYSETLRLTVSTQSAFITLAQNHLVIKDPADNTNYYKEFSASVVDTAGNAVANQKISISIDLTHFLKGYYSWVYDYNFTQGTGGWSWLGETDWKRTYTQRFVDDTTTSGYGYREVTNYVECPSQEFPNPVAILAADGSILGTTATFVTDAQGKFDFKVRYGRNYSNWLRVNLNASTTVSTKDNLTALSFMPPVAAADVDDVNGYWRPDEKSPYGTDFSTCLNYK